MIIYYLLQAFNLPSFRAQGHAEKLSPAFILLRCTETLKQFKHTQTTGQSTLQCVCVCVKSMPEFTAVYTHWTVQ